jgi:putative phage-type endonuclease
MGDVGRALFLESRRKGIGGTDAAAILGLSKWRTPLGVWLEKRGEAPPDVDDEPKRWGRMLEPLIASRYAEQTGIELVKPPGMVRHPEHEFILGNLDYLPLDRRALGVECKTARYGDDWGEDGTDEVPPAYLVQCQHYMAVTGYPRWDVAALIAGSDFRIYPIEGDREFQRELVEIEAEWWQRCIVRGERPPMDGSDATSRWLKFRFPEVKLPIERAGIEVNALAERLAHARVKRDLAAAEAGTFENAMKESIGERAGLEAEGWRATWKWTRGRKATDWEAVARALFADATIPSAVFEEAVAAHTSERPGYRRFLFKSSLAVESSEVEAAQ